MNAPVVSSPGTMRSALQPTADPAWTIDQHGFDPLRDGSRQSRFAVSNGFLGIRGDRAINRGPDGVVPPCTYVAGLFDVRGVEQPIPAMVPAPDWLRVDVAFPAAFPGQAAALILGDVSSHYRTLDLRRGALLSGGSVAAMPGLAIRLRVLRLVSLSERAVGLQLIQIEVEDGEAEISLSASFDDLDFGLSAERIERDLGVWRTRASGKRIAMASAASLRIDGDVLIPSQPGPFKSVWSWRTRPGQTVCFERMVAVARGDAEADDPGGAVRRTLDASCRAGWRRVLDAHGAAWADRWRYPPSPLPATRTPRRRFASPPITSTAPPTRATPRCRSPPGR